MTTNDPVPEADRLEQEVPAQPEDRPNHRSHAEASEADAFEQELPLSESPTDRGIDAERSEPWTTKRTQAVIDRGMGAPRAGGRSRMPGPASQAIAS